MSFWNATEVSLEEPRVLNDNGFCYSAVSLRACTRLFREYWKYSFGDY